MTSLGRGCASRLRASFSDVTTLNGRTARSTLVTVSLKILVPKRSLCALRSRGANVQVLRALRARATAYRQRVAAARASRGAHGRRQGCRGQ